MTFDIDADDYPKAARVFKSADKKIAATIRKGMREIAKPLGEQVVRGERLLDEQQAEPLEREQVGDVARPVGLIGVDLQGQVVAERLAHRADGLDVPPGSHLEFDAVVAVLEVPADPVEEVVDRIGDADGDADGDPVAVSAEIGRQGHAGGAEFGVEGGAL